MSQFNKLIFDLKSSLKIWRFWSHLGWEDIAKQYRRSILGPVWITLNTGLFILIFGLVGAQLFKSEVSHYLPYLCVGHIFFSYITLIFNEGCQVYIQSGSYIKQSPFPKFAFVFRVVWRNLLMLAHNIPIVCVVLFLTSGFENIIIGWFLLGVLFLILFSIFSVAILGLISARFRDIPMIVTSLMQIAFFVTPVMWRPEQLTERAQIAVMLNPFAAFLEIVRAPLLGYIPSGSTWLVAIVFLFILLCLCIFFYILGRRRIVYWI